MVFLFWTKTSSHFSLFGIMPAIGNNQIVQHIQPIQNGGHGDAAVHAAVTASSVYPMRADAYLQNQQLAPRKVAILRPSAQQWCTKPIIDGQEVWVVLRFYSFHYCVSSPPNSSSQSDISGQHIPSKNISKI
jgi:hypothetical protein